MNSDDWTIPALAVFIALAGMTIYGLWTVATRQPSRETCGLVEPAGLGRWRLIKPDPKDCAGKWTPVLTGPWWRCECGAEVTP